MLFRFTLLRMLKPFYTFSTAPMMDWSDRHWRVFVRLLTKHSLLYTEMITAKALIRGNLDRLTQHSPSEYPLAFQIGGSEPEELYQAVNKVTDFGFCEFNLNLGCPSGRVRAGHFGAALMADPDRVSECICAMRSGVRLGRQEITVKIRLGIDNQEVNNSLPEFIEMLNNAEVKRVIIHARKAILNGLSPKQNREIPSLDYSIVRKMKKKFSNLKIVVNGGLKTVNECVSHLDHLDGVMMGRAAYHTPKELLKVDPLIYGTKSPCNSTEEALLAYRPYVEKTLAKGFPLRNCTRHLVGLYHNVPGAKQFRQILSEQSHKSGADWNVIEKALSALIKIDNS